MVFETMANVGLLYFMFLVGVEMDIGVVKRTGRKAFAIAVSGMILPFLFGISFGFMLHTGIEIVTLSTFILFLGLTLSVTAFPILARILAELKLLNTQLGRMAMSAALINDMCAWVLLAFAIALAENESMSLVSVWVVLSSAVFVLFCFYVVKPLISWMMNNTPEDESVSEFYICLILTGVMISGFVTDAIGTHSVFGAFVFGLIIPNGSLGVGNMGPPHHPDHFGLQHCENKRKHSDEDTGSEQLSENRNDSRNSSKKPHDYKLKKDKEASSSHYGDSLAQRSGRKSWNDQHVHSDVDERHDRGSRSSATGTGKRSSNSEWLNSAKHDLPRNFERQDNAKHTHSHHHGVSKKYHDKRGHYDSDSTMGHEPTQKDVKRRYDHDDGGSHKKHHGSSETGFVHHSSSHRRVEYKERDSRYDDNHLREKQRDDRQKPVHGWDEDIRGEYRVHKRRAY